MNKSNKPKASILIPTYNRPNMLATAIKSALEQDYENIEVIVSDNASDIDISGVIEHFLKDSRLKFFRQEINLGMGGNWRKCLYEYATGDWFLLLSDDDELIDKHYITKAMEQVADNITLIYANGYIEHTSTNTMSRLTLPFKGTINGGKVFLSRGKVIPQDFTLCNILFRKSMAIEMKAFQDDLCLGMDSELFLKMCLLGDVHCIANYVSIYKLHATNLISSLSRDKKYLVNALNAYINASKFAMEQQCFKEADLQEWNRRNIVLFLEGLLLKAKRYHKECYMEIENSLNEKVKNIPKCSSRSLRFMLKLSLLSLSPQWMSDLYFSHKNYLKSLHRMLSLKRYFHD